MTTRPWKTLAVAATVVALNGSTAVPATAQDPPPLVAAVGGALGRCQLVAVSTVDAQWTGAVVAGPIASTGRADTVIATCTVQVGAANWAHNGADAAAVTSPAMLQVATIPPVAGLGSVVVEFARSSGQPIYVCTHAVVNGATWYWDDIADSWTGDSGASCGYPAFEQDVIPGPFEPLFRLVKEVTEAYVAPPVCDVVLEHILPPEGDVPGVWNCPPYG